MVSEHGRSVETSAESCPQSMLSSLSSTYHFGPECPSGLHIHSHASHVPTSGCFPASYASQRTYNHISAYLIPPSTSKRREKKNLQKRATGKEKQHPSPPLDTTRISTGVRSCQMHKQEGCQCAYRSGQAENQQMRSRRPT